MQCSIVLAQSSLFTHALWDDKTKLLRAQGGRHPQAPSAADSKTDEGDAIARLQDSWEDSDEDENANKAAAAPSGPAPPIRQKGITKAKIAEKEAQEQERLRAAQARASEDPLVKKQREMKLQMENDLESARSLFGGATIGANGAAALGEDPLLAHADARTKADFEAFAEALSKYIIDTHGGKPLYPHFVEQFVRSLCMPMKDLDVKKCASTLTALGNEKQKLAKEGTGKKGAKGKKPQLGTVAGTGGGAKTAVMGRG